MTFDETAMGDVNRLVEAIDEQEQDLKKDFDFMRDQGVERWKYGCIKDGFSLIKKDLTRTAFLLSNVRFENPADRSAIVDEYIRLFDRMDPELASLEEGETDRRIALLQQELKALETMSISIPEQIKKQAERDVSLWTGEDKALVTKKEADEWREYILQESERMFQILDFQNELEEKYGFKIRVIPYQNANFDIGPTQSEKILLSLEQLDLAFEKYPPSFVQDSGLQEVYLVGDIQTLNGNDADGFQTEKRMVIDLSKLLLYEGKIAFGNIIRTIDHEFLHYLDQDHADDDAVWSTLNANGAKDYTATDGNDYIDNQKKDEGNQDELEKIEGFARSYGRAGVLEDKATIAEALLYPNLSAQLLNRCKNDLVLRKKVMAITGCLYSIEHQRFFRVLTPEEYKKLTGFDSYQYFAKWSQDENGKIQMDHKYWNQIAAGYLKPVLSSH